MRFVVVALLALLAPVLLGATVAASPAAEPGSGTTGLGRLDHVEKLTERRWNVFAYSPSMDEVVELQVIRPQNVEQPRGLALYVSSATGLPGPYEMPGVNRPVGAPSLPDQILIGGTIEAAANYCTHRLAQRLDELAIPATFDFRPTGTHSWMYWQDALHRSWPVLARALRVLP